MNRCPLCVNLHHKVSSLQYPQRSRFCGNERSVEKPGYMPEQSITGKNNLLKVYWNQETEMFALGTGILGRN
jgi:hypothetical protein